MYKAQVIGIDLGGTNVRCGLVSGNELIDIKGQRIRSKGTEEEVMQDIISCINEVITMDVRAIGMGVPGVLDTKAGVVYDIQNIPSWKKVPVKAILEEHFQLPVYLNNDANCFAAGEWRYGKGRGFSDVVGLILGTGVAAGLICNAKLYEGSNCGAGEFGMLPYLAHNYEFYCSGNFFSQFHQISGEQLSQLAQQGDARANDIFFDYGKHLSAVIKAVLYTMDPEIIVLGGSVSKAFPYFKESLWTHLADFAYQPILEKIKIEPSALDHVAVLGAAALTF